MKRLVFIIFLLFLNISYSNAEENIRKVATWNMKWLGTNSGNQLDAVETVPEYVKYIVKTGATFFALQEIAATHSLAGKPRCYYLDLIVQELNRVTNKEWQYELDDRNKSQRLAFLYRTDLWQVNNPYSITPGSSFTYIRKPYVISVKAIGDNAELEFVFINIHLKAFDDTEAREQRRSSFMELATWLESNPLDDDVLIAGDTNIFTGESDVDDTLEDIGYEAIFDREKTAIHDYELGQRFDRFYSSPGLMNEINSAKNIVGSIEYVDVIKDNSDSFLKWFDDNISDHFPVTLSIDVSKER
jgi:endonuclease/exonuclease/phosphatase family metal-dependent hydrolase